MARIKKYDEVPFHMKGLSDMKKEWMDFEDTQPWEFQYFWNKVNAYWSDYNSHFIGKSRNEYELKMVENSVSDIEWRKRNGSISVSTETGGYSGGSCWNDDPAEPYSTGNYVDIDDFLEYIEHILVYIFGSNNKDIKSLLEYLRNSPHGIIKEDSNTDYEYYGNSTDHQFLSMTLWDLYKVLGKFYIM